MRTRKTRRKGGPRQAPRVHQIRLSRRAVKERAEGLLRRHLRLKDYSGTCPAQVVYVIVLYAAARLTSIRRACERLRDVPCDQTLYDALEATLPPQVELQRRLNTALAASLPRSVRRGQRRYPVAIDLTKIPYYGQPKRSRAELYKGEWQAGTNTFHAYATAYLVRRGRRFTLALMTLSDATPWEVVVRTLLRRVKRVIPGFRLVLLDRGFWSVAVLRYLQRARYPFILPVVKRGRQADHPKGPGGTRVFYLRKKSGWARYTLQANDRVKKQGKELRATVPLAISVTTKEPRRQRRDKPAKRKRWVLVYAAWKVKSQNPHWVRETYRGRFGIESSYRQMNQARGKTNTRDPLRRLLLVGLALLLRNLWAYLHLQVLAQPRRGGPRVQLELLRLETLREWIAEVIEDDLRLRRDVLAPRPFFL
jgi:putative transposase